MALHMNHRANAVIDASPVKTIDPKNEPGPTPIIMFKEETKGIPLDHALEAHAEKYGAEDVQAEHVINMAGAFPEEDLDPIEPVKERALRLAGIMLRHANDDPETYKLALSTVLKQRRLLGHMSAYDQRAAGRNSDALESIAGARNGAVPARFIFRLKHATKFERWWTNFGHNEEIRNFTKRFRPGPSILVDNISYWMVVRNAWQSMRPVNGKIVTTVHTDIPTDAQPEQTLGEDYNVFQGLPQQRIGESGKQTIHGDADLLFACLGYRAGRRKLLAGEWILHARSSVQSKAKPTKVKIKGEDKDGFHEESKYASLFSVLKIVGTLASGIVLFFMFVAILGFVNV